MSQPAKQATGWAPPWMLELGVEPNGAVTLTKENLRSLMRPTHPLKVQVWACGMLHTAGYAGEVAWIMRDRVKVSLRPADIARELHTEAKKHYRQAGVNASEAEFALLKESKDDIRRALAALEAEDGVAERRTRDGKPLRSITVDQRRRLSGGQIRIAFLAKPKPANPEMVRREWLNSQAQSNTPPDDAQKIQVGKPCLPAPSIQQILKIFAIQVPEKSKLTSNTYQRTVARAWESARRVFIEVLAEEVGAGSVPGVCMESLPEVGIGGGTIRNGSEREVGKAQTSAVHHHQSSLKTEKAARTPRPFMVGDDDEKASAPKEYASACEELKAIYKAKTGELPSIQLWDRLESMLACKGKVWDDLLESLKSGNHLPNVWTNPPGFLTDYTRKLGLEREVSLPQERPKPKCPVCHADNQRGAILRDNAIVPCPECSTPEWAEELAAKIATPPINKRVFKAG